MEQERLLALLRSVKDGSLSPEEAVLTLKMQPFEDIGYAKIDHHRRLRHGIAEVIYGEGKTTAQIIGIIEAMHKNGDRKSYHPPLLIRRRNCPGAGNQYDPVPYAIHATPEVTAPGLIAVSPRGRATCLWPKKRP